MKKIEGKVFFEFEGFETIEIKEPNQENKTTKLNSRNFDKILNLLVSQILMKRVNHQIENADIPSSAFKAILDNYKPYIQHLINKGNLQRCYFVFKTTGKANPAYFIKITARTSLMDIGLQSSSSRKSK